MSSNSNSFCTLCKYSNNNNNNFICPHNNSNITDLNQTIPTLIPDVNSNSINHQGLQEFQFFGNDDTLAWLFNEDSSKASGINIEELQQRRRQAVVAEQKVQGVNCNYLDLEGGLRNSCNRERLTFDVCLSGTTSSPDSMIGQSPPVEVRTTSNIVSIMDQIKIQID